MSVDRRKFIAISGVSAVGLAMPSIARGSTKPRVVIIGGGAGGATAARDLSKRASGALDIILIEPNKEYISCFFSNFYLADMRELSSLTHSYSNLRSVDGISVLQEYAHSIDRANSSVLLASGKDVAYDRLILSPGIDFDFDSTPGYSSADIKIAPHAWQAGEQVDDLKRKLNLIEDGQQIIIVPPEYPYRCPPAPYERASLIARWLMENGRPNSGVTILDPKTSFSKQALFSQGWEQHYPGMIEWFGPDIHGGIVNIDAQSGVVETDFDDFEADLLNIIPNQRAADITLTAGLTNETGFCPIEASSMRSKIDPSIFVIGDSCDAGQMPKSAFSANSQAKVCAKNIVADLLDGDRGEAEFGNACFSLLSEDNGIVVSAQYGATTGKIERTDRHISQLDETSQERAATYQRSLQWYDKITTDMFG